MKLKFGMIPLLKKLKGYGKKEGSFFRDIIVDAKDGRNERGFALFERIRARGNARGSTRAVW